jgi:hypothetical protein
MRWRDAGAAARTAAADCSATIQQRTDAIVVLQRDTRATIVLRRRLELDGGELGHHARNALLAVDQALR